MTFDSAFLVAGQERASEDVVDVVNPRAIAPFLLIAEHAGNSIPVALRGLGIDAKECDRHIGWDIGAGMVARRLAGLLNTTAVLACVSRLVIDLNRPLGDPDCIPETSDGTRIPGNQGLSEAEMARRARTYYWPYHCAVDEQLGRLRLAGVVPAVVGIHSFTPALQSIDKPRPWHVGIMFSYDDGLARRLISALEAEPGLIVGENEPYSGVTLSYAQKIHGLAQCLPHAQVEIRQDLIENEAGHVRWAEILHRALIRATTGAADG